jgi:hypothetical protein
MSGINVMLTDGIEGNPTPYPGMPFIPVRFSEGSAAFPNIDGWQVAYPDVNGWQVAFPDINGWQVAYPNPDGWLVGVEPATFSVELDRGWTPVEGTALLLDGRVVVGVLGQPTFRTPDGDYQTEGPVVLIDLD